MPRGSGGGVLRAVCSSREARDALLFSLECLDLDLISLSWGLACHRVGSELQGSMQGEAQLVSLSGGSVRKAWVGKLSPSQRVRLGDSDMQQTSGETG